MAIAFDVTIFFPLGKISTLTDNSGPIVHIDQYKNVLTCWIPYIGTCSFSLQSSNSKEKKRIPIPTYVCDQAIVQRDPF